jgi:hypothetical protein
LVAAVTVAPYAIQLQQHLAWLATSSQTTIDGWQIQDHAPRRLCRSGSALFCFKKIKDLKHQLNDAIAFERGHADQLRCCGNNNPKSWVR